MKKRLNTLLPWLGYIIYVGIIEPVYLYNRGLELFRAHLSNTQQLAVRSLLIVIWYEQAIILVCIVPVMLLFFFVLKRVGRVNLSSASKNWTIVTITILISILFWIPYILGFSTSSQGL
jgi:hypothetical protein